MMKRTLVPALVLAVGAATPAISMAGVTGNIGYVSDYVFRGILSNRLSAFAGVDYRVGQRFLRRHVVGGRWRPAPRQISTSAYNGGSDSVKYKIGYTVSLPRRLRRRLRRDQSRLYAGILRSTSRRPVRRRQIPPGRSGERR